MIKKKGYNPPYINGFSESLLGGFYTKNKDEIADDVLARAAYAFSFGDEDLAQRIYDAAWNGWFMFSSPIISNAPEGNWKKEITDEDWQSGEPLLQYWDGDTDRGLPISCFAGVAPDTIDGQIFMMQEIAALSVAGGGVGIHNKIRAITEKAPGPIPFEKMVDASVGYYKQSKTRRGSIAYYMDISHPDILEHIKFRVPSGGDRKRKSDNLTQYHSAVNITDEFVDAVINDSDFNLTCPHSGEVREVVRARKLWEELLDTRALTGEPYINMIDKVNRALPEAQKQLGLQVLGSNLCVSQDTLVLTRKGEFPIKDLEGQGVEVWNGHGWSTVTVRQTGSGQSLIRVALKEVHSNTLTYIDCTPEHHFYLENGTRIEAQELAYGDLLEGWSNPDGVSVRGQMVLSIEPVDGLHNTYCFTEPIRHRGVFNGVLTGQCNEIHLPTNDERTFVCCLSSLNLEKYDEWKDTSLVADLVQYLDNVLQWFIERTDSSEPLKRANYSAMRERALGIGAMGWHRYLQSKNIPFESGGFNSAIQHTHQIFKNIKEQAVESSLSLGISRGEAPDMVGTGRRNSHLLAIAPNANSGIILGTSPCIEPEAGVVYMQNTRLGTHMVKNPYFQEILDLQFPDDIDQQSRVYDSILHNDGSVQHLEWLTDEQKDVFRTAYEIDQHYVIEQADARQQYLCQGQSLNVFFPSGVPRDYFNSVHLKAVTSKYIKGLYYSRVRRGEQTTGTSFKQGKVETFKDWSPEDSSDCIACEG